MSLLFSVDGGDDEESDGDDDDDDGSSPAVLAGEEAINDVLSFSLSRSLALFRSCFQEGDGN